jgi:hypothetical protein
MFLFHVAFPLGLMALVAGTWLYVWATNIEGEGTGFAKLIGVLVILFAITNTVCVSYFSYRMFQSMGGFSAMMSEKGMMGEKMTMPAAAKKR